MPSYTFKCNNCGNELTLKLAMSDERPTVCEKCNGKLERDYSSVRCDGNVEKRDPKHTNYWKRGKSDSQIADVIGSKTDPY